MIDLRSDTVTKPTEGMLQAMMNASVGDDVFNEDPTAKELENRLAELFGHEAGLFCPSGTMTNQIAIQVHTRPGDSVICHRDAHIYQYEGGGIARNSGCSVSLLEGAQGMFKAEDVEKAIHADEDWLPRSSLVSVEDTMNRGGGACWETEDLDGIKKLCHQRELKFHLDGARVFNAIVAKGHDPQDYGRRFDSISICLSKGLGSPVGSVLIGSNEFIRNARRVRKVMGGGMRQVGILAAAGIYALDHHVDRLSIDHARAKRIAEAMNSSGRFSHVRPVETNILIAEMPDEAAVLVLLSQLEKQGILGIHMGSNLIRLVTHGDLSESDIEQTIEVIRD